MADASRLRVLLTANPSAPWQQLLVYRLKEVADVTRAVEADGVPDLIVDLAPNHPLQRSRFGTLHYAFADGAASAQGAAGTLVRLYRTSDAGVVQTLREGWFRGSSDESSGTPDVAECVSGWCPRVVERLSAGDACALSGEPAETAECSDPQPPRLRAPLAVRARNRWRRWRRRERWTVGIVRMPVAEILGSGTMPEPTWVSGIPPDCYVADPFPVSATGSCVRILAEEYAYRSGLGHLVELTVAADGAVLERAQKLAPNHHVAYPFVLSDGESQVCVPDAAASGAIRAYAMPFDGSAPATLIDGFPGVDPTIVRHDGRWWLFCTHRDRENQTELHAFYAGDWRGPWQPHALNPVKSDARSGRPAGAFFRLDGRLYRPAQDCSRRYGGALAINEIEELTPAMFRERVVLRLRPDPSWAWPDGLHTFNAIGGLVVVDGLRVER